MGDNKTTSCSWWFGSHSSTKRSPWLHATLSDLERKILGMVNLIEGEADSFSQRAEMYYKKRPELVNLMEDFYRSYRSLAEQHDLLRSEAGTQFTVSVNSNFSNRSWSQDGSDSDASEVHDPEPEAMVASKDETKGEEPNKREQSSGHVLQLRSEVERLEKEKEILKAELEVKDEAKRQVIRQLSLAVQILKEENVSLKGFIVDCKRRGGKFEFNKLKGAFSGAGKLFRFTSKRETSLSLVAL
ncbi:hypothetical protein HPP92_001194 [Vanilla planifolia]|uniref:NAB domain-containing protein n=1 Tax=Vanilla planifolia TaxID=51239 RepID=A0A835SCI2_VANPL|nr:hypothetical protein HPP92_001194 [Vanilla planifolia]